MRRSWSSSLSGSWGPRRRAVAWFLLAISASVGAVVADEPTPSPLGVVPERVLLRGPDAVQQIAIEASEPGGPARDLTDVAEFSSSDPDIAEVDRSGTIRA